MYVCMYVYMNVFIYVILLDSRRIQILASRRWLAMTSSRKILLSAVVNNGVESNTIEYIIYIHVHKHIHVYRILYQNIEYYIVKMIRESQNFKLQ